MNSSLWVTEAGGFPMGVVWLVIAVLCVAAGVVLLMMDRRRRAAPPPPPRVPEPRSPAPDEDLFTPEALPRTRKDSPQG